MRAAQSASSFVVSLCERIINLNKRTRHLFWLVPSISIHLGLRAPIINRFSRSLQWLNRSLGLQRLAVTMEILFVCD
jgi:hypothetical protein